METATTAPQDPVSHPHHAYGKKRINTAFLITLAIIVVIAIAIILFFMLRGHSSASSDKMNVTYSIALENGTVIDSGAGVFNVGKVGTGIGMITNGLDSEISSMKSGDEKTIILEAKNAYGAYDENATFTYNRTDRMKRESIVNKTMTVALDEFKGVFNETPETGKEYSLTGAPWAYKAISKNETYVVLEQQAAVGKTIPYGIFNYEVTKVTDDKITLMLQGNDSTIPAASGNPKIEVKFTKDEVIITMAPEIGQIVSLGNMPEARVVKLDANYVYLDANPEFAGEKISVTIKVDSRFKEKVVATGSSVVAGAPTLQVFIMSHCPYGTQILKGFIPVMEKFAGKANVELRFVSYTMHGAQEDLDNKRIVCVREEQSSKLIDYLNCFVSGSGSEADTQKCIANLDKAKLDSCVASRADGYLEADKALNTEYGVEGSPTIVLDGKTASIGRDPQSLATALCNAFIGSKPSVCSETFSSTSPSPGFGTSAGGSSGGSCGS